MAADGRRESGSVREQLFSDGSRFSFMQAVRLLEQMHARDRRHGDAKVRERSAPGEGVSPQHELVLFRHAVRLDFAESDVDHLLDLSRDHAPTEMTVNILGLTGPNGPLPQHVTEQVIEQLGRGKRGARDFLDVFNHRLISLLYRAHKKYRPQLDPRGPAHGRVSTVLFSLLGMGFPELRRRLGLDDRSLLAYTGFFVNRHRPVVGLERVVRHCFGVEAKVDPFHGRWQSIEREDRTRIGISGRNRRLGLDTVLGGRYWDQAASFEVKLGPMPFAKFRSFLRSGEAFAPLAALVRFYAREELDFTFRLSLPKREIPPLRLTRQRANGALLGWTSWLRDETAPDAAIDAQVRLAGTP
jgi:type VI secretion system protein ImpH